MSETIEQSVCQKLLECCKLFLGKMLRTIDEESGSWATAKLTDSQWGGTQGCLDFLPNWG
jgi:hypothetical protein